jgi:hypothetical protein
LQVALADSLQGACFLWAALMSRAMASARLCWSRPWAVAEVRSEISPSRFSASARPSRLPRSPNRAKAGW